MTSKSKSKKDIKQKVLLTSIVVDDREKQVIPYFEEYTIKVNVGRVTTGDYSIIIKDPDNPKKFKPVVIFERKTWKDFADSIKDGRMENNQNLHEFRQKYNCRIIFIVEGQPFPADNRKFRGIPFKNIQKKIDRMMLADEFQIIQTRDQKMTAKRIVEIAIAYDQYYDEITKVDQLKKSKPESVDDIEKSNKKNIQSVKNVKSKKDTNPIKKGGHDEEESSESNDESSEKSEEESGGESGDESDDASEEMNFIPDELKQVRTKTNDRILQQMWNSLPQVSNMTAKVLSEKYSISQIVSGKVFVRDIAELKYPSGMRIGEERAKKILVVSNEPKKGGNVVTLSQAIEFTKAQEKLLKSIHGVSAIVAKQICKKYTLKQLCESVDEKQLAEVKRSDQPNARNLGPALAKRILELLKSKNV